MLVLTRRIGERIFLDNGKIEIALLYHRRGQVAFGIKAPPNMDIDRQEIFLLKQQNKMNENTVSSSDD